ncbi:hypothetical protein [Nocardia brevicatena]|nr:hypothetical protein [Nocardia brevicatena]
MVFAQRLDEFVDSLTTAAPRVDIGSLIDQALRSADEDSVRVRVGPK